MLVVVKVVKTPELVVVTVLVTTVSVPLAKNFASDTSSGVFVFEQDSCKRTQTFSSISLPWAPMHVAVLKTKSPVFEQRHWFVSVTVSPSHPEMSAASSRHD